MKLIDVDVFKDNLDKKFSFGGLEAKFMLFDEIDNVVDDDVFDLEAHDKEIEKRFADKVKKHLSEVEDSIVEQRNSSENLSKSKMLIGMQTCIEDFLGWLYDNTIYNLDEELDG